jgi:GGDEF domain-containing protein
MSANMASAVGDKRWIKRYDENIPVMDEAIRAATELAPPAAVARFDEETRASNDHLVELERASFEKVRAGDLNAARQILDGEDYALHKTILSEVTSRFSESVIASVREEVAEVKQSALVVIGAALAISMIGGAVLWRIFSGSLRRSVAAFTAREETIKHLALNDVLTGLANRASMRHALGSAIQRAALKQSKLALLMIDLDRFKPINDRHGHLIGDLVLQEVAARIAQVLQDRGLRARYGGDEFVAVVEYEADDEIPRAVGERIVKALSAPMALGGWIFRSAPAPALRSIRPMRLRRRT